MKKLMTTIVWFLAPVILYLVALEIIVGQIPNSYSYKYNYIKTKGESIEAIAMGHSQLYDDFYPQFFSLPTFNLSNSNQTFEDNYYLLEELLPYMPNLKMAIFPIGYFDVGEKEKEEEITDRSRYYHKYMNINYGGKLPLKYMLECFNPRLATNKVYQYYVQHIDMVGCDSLGTRNNHYLKDRERELSYWNIESYTVSCDDISNLCLRNETYLIKIIELLSSARVMTILVSPPYYWNNYQGVNHSQKKIINNMVNVLKKKYDLYYIDMEDDTTFQYDDFYDETHLNEFGGRKFTIRLNDCIKDSLQLID